LAAILSRGASQDPRRTANLLIREFGSMPAVLSARPHLQLRACQGDAAAVHDLRVFSTIMLYALRRRTFDLPSLASWTGVIDYLHADMAMLAHERVRILHLNTRNGLIRDEVASEGSIDEAAVYVREVMRRCLELGSAAIIIVHNHPSGDTNPSRADIDITRKMAEAGKCLNVTVHDHLIIGASGHSSFRLMGLL
jgi:DNA repair protein RadC